MDCRPSFAATFSSAIGAFRPSFASSCARRAGPFAVARRTTIVTKGEVADFRPFSMAVAADRTSLYVVDWAYNGWLDAGAQTGRLYRLIAAT